MGRLTVTFLGVCTHFRYGVVPGVPHRVVLPDASAFRFGMLNIGGEATADPYTYFLTPHLPYLRTDAVNQERLTIPGLMTRGSLLGGVRIQVANAIDRRVEYAKGSGELRSLGDFVERYEWSHEVVLGGRAACYFDIFGGVITPVMLQDNASCVVATFETPTGRPPELRVTPLLPLQTSDPQPEPIVLGDGADSEVQLVVANMSDDCHRIGDQKVYDYLLHYITARGGIPRILKTNTPGLLDPQSMTKPELTAVLGQMEFTHVPDGVKPLPPLPQTAGSLLACGLDDLQITSASCSNSGYP